MLWFKVYFALIIFKIALKFVTKWINYIKLCEKLHFFDLHWKKGAVIGPKSLRVVTLFHDKNKHCAFISIFDSMYQVLRNCPCNSPLLNPMLTLTSYLGREGRQMLTGTLYWNTLTQIDCCHQSKGKERKNNTWLKNVTCQRKIELRQKTIFLRGEITCCLELNVQVSRSIVSHKGWCCLLIISTI